MFVSAIEKAVEFTRPIHTISRNYGSKTVQPGASTMFFVNADGWALTCKHVAQHLIVAGKLQRRRKTFLQELSNQKGKGKKKAKRNLEKKYGLNKNETYEICNNFINCVEGPLDADIKMHAECDVALIHFKGFDRLLCDSFPIFAKNGSDLKQGKYLCRLGFPFVEFTNFDYDSATDSIRWTDSGRKDTPRFPIEGMVTRHVGNKQGKIIGFELSTPGLRGQSGGPVFDVDGAVWGMQSSTAHLDLNFDIDQQVLRGGKKKKVSDHAFLHVGHCIHVEVLKDFMHQHDVNHNEG